jgi:hypothetical protein
VGYNKIPGALTPLAELERRVHTLETTPRALDTGAIALSTSNVPSIGVVFDPAWTLTGGLMYQRVGPSVQIYITSFVRAGADIPIGSSGDVTNTTVFTLPPFLSPYPNHAMGYAGSAGRVANFVVSASATGSVVQLTAVAGMTDVVTGEILSFYGVWFTSNAPNV